MDFVDVKVEIYSITINTVEYNTGRYSIELRPNRTLVIVSKKFQEKSLIISPVLFALVILFIALSLLASLTPVAYGTILVLGIIAYLFTIRLIKKNIWEKIEIIPAYYYGFSFILTTLVGFIVPIIAFTFQDPSVVSIPLVLEIVSLIYSAVIYISLCIFMLSIRSKTIIYFDREEAVYFDHYLIFPYTLNREMHFRSNGDEPLQLLVKTLEFVNKDAISMSRTSIAYSLSEEEFHEFQDNQSEFLIALYDPQNNPVIESVLCFRGTKMEIEEFFRILRQYIHFRIKKIQDAKITTIMYGGGRSELISDS